MISTTHFQMTQKKKNFKEKIKYKHMAKYYYYFDLDRDGYMGDSLCPLLNA